ncbi:MAG: hypothetical protein ACK5LV_02990 [Lachnospirales bacterium]
MKKIYIYVFVMVSVLFMSLGFSHRNISASSIVEEYMKEFTVNSVYYSWPLETFVYTENEDVFKCYDKETLEYIDLNEYLEKYLNSDENGEYYIEIKGDRYFVSQDQAKTYKIDENDGSYIFYDWMLEADYKFDAKTSEFSFYDEVRKDFVDYQTFMLNRNYSYDYEEKAYYKVNDDLEKKVFYDVFYELFYFYSDDDRIYYYDKFLDYFYTFDNKINGEYIFYDVKNDVLLTYDVKNDTMKIVEEKDIFDYNRRIFFYEARYIFYLGFFIIFLIILIRGIRVNKQRKAEEILS